MYKLYVSEAEINVGQAYDLIDNRLLKSSPFKCFDDEMDINTEKILSKLKNTTFNAPGLTQPNSNYLGFCFAENMSELFDFLSIDSITALNFFSKPNSNAIKHSFLAHFLSEISFHSQELSVFVRQSVCLHKLKMDDSYYYWSPTVMSDENFGSSYGQCFVKSVCLGGEQIIEMKFDCSEIPKEMLKSAIYGAMKKENIRPHDQWFIDEYNLDENEIDSIIKDRPMNGRETTFPVIENCNLPQSCDFKSLGLLLNKCKNLFQESPSVVHLHVTPYELGSINYAHNFAGYNDSVHRELVSYINLCNSLEQIFFERRAHLFSNSVLEQNRVVVDKIRSNIFPKIPLLLSSLKSGQEIADVIPSFQNFKLTYGISETNFVENSIDIEKSSHVELKSGQIIENPDVSRMKKMELEKFEEHDSEKRNSILQHIKDNEEGGQEISEKTILYFSEEHALGETVKVIQNNLETNNEYTDDEDIDPNSEAKAHKYKNLIRVCSEESAFPEYQEGSYGIGLYLKPPESCISPGHKSSKFFPGVELTKVMIQLIKLKKESYEKTLPLTHMVSHNDYKPRSVSISNDHVIANLNIPNRDTIRNMITQKTLDPPIDFPDNDVRSQIESTIQEKGDTYEAQEDHIDKISEEFINLLAEQETGLNLSKKVIRIKSVRETLAKILETSMAEDLPAKQVKEIVKKLNELNSFIKKQNKLNKELRTKTMNIANYLQNNVKSFKNEQLESVNKLKNFLQTYIFSLMGYSNNSGVDHEFQVTLKISFVKDNRAPIEKLAISFGSKNGDFEVLKPKPKLKVFKLNRVSESEEYQKMYIYLMKNTTHSFKLWRSLFV